MDGDSIARMGLTLALLLGVPGLLLWALRRFGWRMPGQLESSARLKMISRLPLDSRHALLLVRRDTHEQLLLLGPAGATIIDPEVKLSPADRAEHRRRAREEAERVAAARAAVVQARARSAAMVAGASALLRKAVARLVTIARPGFHRLVEQAMRGRRPAVPAPPDPRRTAPRGRPTRSHRRGSKAAA